MSPPASPGDDGEPLRRELRRELRIRLGPTPVVQAWLAEPLADWAWLTPLEIIESGPEGVRVLLEWVRRYGV